MASDAEMAAALEKIGIKTAEDAKLFHEAARANRVSQAARATLRTQEGALERAGGRRIDVLGSPQWHQAVKRKDTAGEIFKAALRKIGGDFQSYPTLKAIDTPLVDLSIKQKDRLADFFKALRMSQRVQKAAGVIRGVVPGLLMPSPEELKQTQDREDFQKHGA